MKRTIDIELPQRRFGFIAIEKGFIKADHLFEALMKQREQEIGGVERRPLGMILKDLGYLSISQIEEVLQELEAKAQAGGNAPKALKPSRRDGHKGQ